MSQRPNTWPCPGCDAQVYYSGRGRRGEYCTRECRRYHLARISKAETAAKRAAKALLPKPSKRKKYLSILCAQCGKPLGPATKLYCSRECNHRAKYGEVQPRKMPTVEAGTCSICKETIIVSLGYQSKPEPMIPESMTLCGRHRRGYGGFISHNKYRGYDPDEVFTAYLVYLTFPNSGRQPHMVMIREAIHAAGHGG